MNHTTPPEIDWETQVHPLSDQEASKFYWKTEIPSSEIIEAFGLGCSASKLCEHVGPAIVKLRCEVCGDWMRVRSRSEAREVFRDHRKRDRLRERHGVAKAAYWVMECRSCLEVRLDRARRPHKEAAEIQRRRQAELRFMPYREYLQTPEWQATREQAKRRARYKCQTCSSGGELHVHHRTYARRGQEYASDLIVLCADCHEIFHRHGRLAENGRAA